MSSGFLNPQEWDGKSKDFIQWLREVEAQKLTIVSVTGLKNYHGLYLKLHIPEGSETRTQILDKIGMDGMGGDVGGRELLIYLNFITRRIRAHQHFKHGRNLEH